MGSSRCYACRKHHQRCRYNRQDGECDYCLRSNYQCRPASKTTATFQRPERSSRHLTRSARAQLHWHAKTMPLSASAPASAPRPEATASPTISPPATNPAVFAVSQKEISDEKDDGAAVITNLKEMKVQVRELTETMRTMEEEFQDVLKTEHEKHAKELRSLKAKFESELRQQRDKYEARMDNLIDIFKQTRRPS
ncbi:hypothetical protein F5B20DRAFT_234865 [Whalleya microplaca]|nr:hypothetical protein F5B20DRAFT_234865 [Whalleya microplaca]